VLVAKLIQISLRVAPVWAANIEEATIKTNIKICYLIRTYVPIKMEM